MTAADSQTRESQASRRTLIAGLAFCLVAAAITWPFAISFGDEVGYLGQSQLFLSGRIAPLAASPGVFHSTPAGAIVSKYPLFVPLVLAPLLAFAPRAIFAIGLGAVVVMTLMASRILRRLGAEPALALLFVAHPTFILIARTAMPDTWLAAAALAAWWFGRQGRRAITAALMALVVLLKPTGMPIAGALVAGELVDGWLQKAGVAAIARRAAPSLVGIAAGLLGVAALNLIQWHHLGYTYSVTFDAVPVPAFSLAYVRTSGLTTLASLALAPPGLILGAWGLWRRRLFGPLFVVLGLVGMMSVYVFVDTGRSRVETLILAQRLVLPASAFLLLGYALLLAPLLRRARLDALARPALAVLAPAVALAIGWQHRSWQRPMHEALLGAERLAREKHATTLGSSPSALKASLMHRGPVALAGELWAHPPVVLCSVSAASYRQTFATSCDLSGYEPREAYDSFRVLVER